MFRSVVFLILSVFSLYASQSESYAPTKTQIENRWAVFQKNRTFSPFKPGKSDAELKEEFAQIDKTRRSLWETTGYELAQHLLTSDLIRAPGCVAFDYNNTAPYYNASTLYLGGRYYIACEGPRSKDIPKFFNLLNAQNITHLVRLTGSYDAWSKKCHPYWDGFITESNGKTYLNVPTDSGVHPVQAFQMDEWRDNQGVDPKALLTLVLEVREELKKDNSLLVVHCSAGVGRTGTFIAALAIVDAIDKGLPFSIEEIVYRLSLQRVHTVSRASQYTTLYRLAENYLNS